MSINNMGERIKNLRTGLGLYQQDLAEKVSVEQSVISKYERGASYPSLDVLVKLVKALDTTADYLLGLTDFE